MSETEQADDGEEEPDDVAEAFFKDSGPGREEMASDYMPGSNDWLAKTLLDVNDPAAIAALSNLGQIYPEVDDLQPLVDGVLDEFLRGKTSVGGRSREEYRKILMSMYGKSDADAEDGLAMQLVAPDDDE
jgi:hypothetical protein